MQIRVAHGADESAVEEVLRGSFGDEAAAIIEVLRLLRASGDLRVELVAEVDGAVVGYVALSTAWLDARKRLVEVLCLSPLGVLPTAQGAGTGTALLSAAVEAAEAAGAPLVFLEGAPRFYADRGWLAASDHAIERPSVRIPAPACRLVTLSAYEEWMTGRLVYPDPWWRLDLVGLRDPDLAEIEEALADN